MADPERYHRQILLPGIGEAGQARLMDAHALVVGCGALGSVIVDTLARAGVGTLSIVDRDTIELTNLQRQVLFDESDVERTIPKAEAARLRVERINSQVRVNAHVDNFSHRNAERYLDAADLILDGLDNFETRFVLNDLAVKHGRPFVYGGAVATGGMSMAVLPHPEKRDPQASPGAVTWSAEQATPCLRCVFPEPPPPGTTPTCDTAGVLGPAALTVAAHQAAQAIKILTGNLEALDRSLLSIDLWENVTRRFDIGAARRDCACCVQGTFEYLAGGGESATTSLCGRNAIQISPSRDGRPACMDLALLAERLAAHGTFNHNGYLLHGRFARERSAGDQPIELTLFPDGRAIIKGTNEPDAARSIYARYVGS
jgi:adenylyltransferase/sulfurtransferase